MNAAAIAARLLENDEQMRRIAFSGFPHRRVVREIQQAYEKMSDWFHSFRVLSVGPDRTAQKWYFTNPVRYGTALLLNCQVGVTEKFKTEVAHQASLLPWEPDHSFQIVRDRMLSAPVKAAVVASDEGIEFNKYRYDRDEGADSYSLEIGLINKYGTARYKLFHPEG